MSNSSIFGRDTPMGCPEVDDRAGVFVPAAGCEKEVPTIKNGAGIVGFGNNDGTLTIYYESNRFDDSKLHPWLAKTRLAYERMVHHKPTTSHQTVAPDKFEQVGLLDGSSLIMTKPEGLQRWLAYCHASDTAPTKADMSWKK
jgi:hypothetical protein